GRGGGEGPPHAARHARDQRVGPRLLVHARLLAGGRGLRDPPYRPPPHALRDRADPHAHGDPGLPALPRARGAPPPARVPRAPAPAAGRRALSGRELRPRGRVLARVRPDPRVAARRVQPLHPPAAPLVDRDRLRPDMRPQPARDLLLREGLLLRLDLLVRG